MDKKDGNKDCDVTMGSFDGAEICQLVGLYVLCILKTKYGRNHNGIYGIYRDDVLACFKHVRGPKADRIRKDFINIYRKEFQLSIVCETNLKIVNFLEVTLDQTTGKYKPYNKPGNIPLYINVKSNHPPSIIKNLPEVFLVVSMNYLPINLYLTILKIFIMHFLAVVLKDKIRFNPDFNKNISRNKNRKRKYAMFPPTLVKVF